MRLQPCCAPWHRYPAGHSGQANGQWGLLPAPAPSPQPCPWVVLGTPPLPPWLFPLSGCGSWWWAQAGVTELGAAESQT